MNDNSSSADKSPSPAEKTIESVGPAQASPTLHVHVICGGIEEAGNYLPPNDDWPAVDAIAVGHYLNVEPQFAELALDNAISERLPSTVAADDGSASANILTDFTRRGIIQGKLGVPFFLPDPRDNKRIIVIAGMGSVGYFAEPQLTFLVLQLFSALARLGRKHLASVLIGSGTGSLGTEVAVARWMRGVARAMADGSTSPAVGHLTFIEHNAAKAEAIRTALTRYKSPPDGPGLTVSASPTSPIPPPPPESSSATTCTRQNTLQPSLVSRWNNAVRSIALGRSRIRRHIPRTKRRLSLARSQMPTMNWQQKRRQTPNEKRLSFSLTYSFPNRSGENSSARTLSWWSVTAVWRGCIGR